MTLTKLRAQRKISPNKPSIKFTRFASFRFIPALILCTLKISPYISSLGRFGNRVVSSFGSEITDMSALTNWGVRSNLCSGNVILSFSYQLQLSVTDRKVSLATRLSSSDNMDKLNLKVVNVQNIKNRSNPISSRVIF